MSMTLGIKLQADGREAKAEIVGVQDSLAGLQGAMRQASSAAPDLSQALDRVGSAGGAAAAQAKGLSSTLDALPAKLMASASALKSWSTAPLLGSSQALDKVAMSAGQTANALRQVPMQFTDIAVSLSSGQSPFTVLMQQGGQLKDSFGGVGSAAKAMGGYVLGLLNPLTLLVAAVGAVGYAYNQGAKEADVYREALVSTGNAAGTSAAQMADMARAMDSTFGVTQGAAAEALAAMAATGRVGSASLQGYAQVALDMERSFGTSIADTAKHFGELGKDPVGASTRLNETMNYLTASTYAQIKAAAQLGETEKAAALAQDAYAAAMKARASEMVSNLGYMERAWASVKNAARESWDAMLGVGRSSTPGQELEKAQRQLADRQASLSQFGNRGGLFGDDTATQVAKLKEQVSGLQEVERMQKRAGVAAAEKAASEKAGIAAIDAVAKANEKGVPKQEQMTKALKEYRDNLALAEKAGAKYSAEQIKNAEAAIREQFKEAAPKKSEAETLAKQQAKAYAELISAMQGKVDAARLESEQTEKLTEAQKQQLSIEKMVRDGKISAKDASSAKTVAMLAELKAAEDLKQAEAFRKAQSDSDQKALEALQKEIEGIRKSNDAMALHNAEIGLTTEQLNALRLARLDNEIAIQAGIVAEYDEAKARGEVTAQMQLEINKLEELNTKRGLTVGGQQAQAAADAAKKATEEWKRASDQINQSLTDALMRGFESGKGFAQNLRDTLKNMFSTLILRPVIQAVVGGVTGLGGASASAGGLSGLFGGGSGAGALGIVDTVKNVYSTITGGFTALGDKVAFAAQDIGAWLTTNTTGALNTFGSKLMSGSGMLGTVGSYAGGALAGYGIGKAISGQYSTSLGKNTLEVGGTALGAILGGPLGAAIGGAIGGVVNRAFGMGAKNVTGEGITGTFGADGASVRGYSDWFQKGGYFRSNKSGRDYSAVSSELDSFLDSSLASVTATAKGYAQVLGLSTGAIDGYTKKIDIKLKGLDAAGREKAISDAIAGFGDSMAEQLLGTFETVTTRTGSFFKRTTQTTSQWIAGPYVRAGETAGQALTRLGTSLQGVNAMLGTLNQTLLSTSLAGADAASQLADAFGGLQAMQQATSAYFQTYYSEAERNAKTTEQLTAALAGMGATLPESIPAWRALVEAQDRTTDAGRKNWAMLIQLAPAFAQVAGAADSLAAKLGKVVSQLVNGALTDIDKQITASTAAADAARAAANAYRDASTSLTAAVASIMGAVGDARQNAEQAYGAALASARGGDVSAMQALPQLATAMLAQQRNGAGNSLQAALQAAKAAADLSGVSSVAGALGVQKDYQAKLYDVNTAALDVLRSTLASGNATVDEIKALSATLTNVGQMLIDSDKLTVGAVTTSSGVIKATLVDTSGRVVGTLDSNSALNLNGLNGQTSVLSKLSTDQISKLQDSTDVQSSTLSLSELATRATSGSQVLLDAVLAQLKLPDPSSANVVSTINSGCQLLASRLDNVVSAISQQSQAQQAEVRRQQDLTKAQKDLEALFSAYTGTKAALQTALNTNLGTSGSLAKQVSDLQANQRFYDPSDTTYIYYQRQIDQLEARRRSVEDTIQSIYSQAAALDERDLTVINALRQTIRSLGGVPAFASGGYTGPGSVNDVAGIVHKGEIVWSQADIARAGGPGRVEAMRVGAVPAALRPVATRSSDQAAEQTGPELIQQIVYLRAELRASLATAQEHLSGMRKMTRGFQSMPVASGQNEPVDVRVVA